MDVLQGGVVSTSPTPKLEDHPLSAVQYCLFNLFAASLHFGGRSSIRNLRTRHAVVTGTHYTWLKFFKILIVFKNFLLLRLSCRLRKKSH